MWETHRCSEANRGREPRHEPMIEGSSDRDSRPTDECNRPPRAQDSFVSCSHLSSLCVKRRDTNLHYAEKDSYETPPASDCLVTSAVNAAWVIEDIPTAIQYTRGPNLIAKEMASAYRPVYDASGSKTGEHLAIAYRSRYLYVVLRQGAGWNSIPFDDNGRYPSIALDSSGKPHMSYFRTSNDKLYYARTVPAGTGNCGPNATWACEEVPWSIFWSTDRTQRHHSARRQGPYPGRNCIGQRDLPFHGQPPDENDRRGQLGCGRRSSYLR